MIFVIELYDLFYKFIFSKSEVYDKIQVVRMNNYELIIYF